MNAKTTERILLAVLGAFLIFTLGFFLGRRLARPAVTIRVSESTEPAAAEPEENTRFFLTESSEKVDINTADQAALEELPGIGPVLAQRIIAYREEHGPFNSLSELTKVEGIGEKTLENLSQYIKVG